MSNKTYDSNSIVALEFPDTARQKVGMYLGDASQRGFFHTFVEILDNSIDEFSSGYGNKVLIKVDSAKSMVSIQDFGRGIPFSKNSDGISALILAMTTLHAGGKHDNTASGSYKYSSGINGVGASVVNAVSDLFYVKSVRNGQIGEITWENGNLSQELKISKNSENIPNGTFVQWIPSVKKDEFDKHNVFENGCSFTKDEIIEKIQYIPYLNIGLSIELDYDGEHITFEKQNSIQNILKFQDVKLIFKDSPEFKEEFSLLMDIKSGNKKVVSIADLRNMSDTEQKKYEFKNAEITLTYNFATTPNPTQLQFANGVRIKGGKGDIAFKQQFKSVINSYLAEQNKKVHYEVDDIFSNLTFMLGIRLNDPSFSGQTKDLLNNPEASTITTYFMKKYLNYWINRQDKKEIESMIRVFDAAKHARESAKKIKIEAFKSISSLKENELMGKMGKLETCTSKDYTKTEIFIVEGDSASGGIRKSRSNKYQAFIPLKGKPLNVIKKANQTKILNNDEIQSLAYALGGLGEDFNIEKLKYNKVVILADADLDGFHIASLMLTFFYHFYPELIEKGYVYVALSPLYKVEYGNNKHVWAWNDEELKEKTDGKRVQNITRNKGLGEMNPEDLFETTLNPINREWVQVQMNDYNETTKEIDIFMGDSKEGKLALKSIFSKFYRTHQNDKKIIHLSSPEDDVT